MCETCGCSDGATATVHNLRTGGRIDIAHHGEEHDHRSGSDPDHRHDHDDHSHAHSHDRDHGRTVSMSQAVLRKNDEIASRNRAWFSGREILALNLVSSPGSGKTTFLERTLKDCASAHDFYVIEGDQATSNDGERIQAAGAAVVQVNTGTGCHLEADMIARGLQELAPAFGAVVMIENVGNLVCPALFDLGERAKVAIVSVTEGEDKPLKYPHMFQAADLVLVNKIDLLPHLSFDVAACVANIHAVNPAAEVLQVSATSGAGMDRWYAWLAARRRAADAPAVG